MHLWRYLWVYFQTGAVFILHISCGRYSCDLYNSPFNTSPPFHAVWSMEVARRC